MIFDHPEQAYLYEQACEALSFNNQHYIVEIGSFRGGSARPLAAAVRDKGGPGLICIDPFCSSYDEGLQAVMAKAGDGLSTLPAFKATVGELIAHIIPIATTSSIALTWLYQVNVKASLVLVDGLHDEISVKRDLAQASLLLAHGGFFLCHDAEWRDVKAAVTTFCESHRLTSHFVCGNSFSKITMR